MDARTLEALKASIAKWEKNVEAETMLDVRMAIDDCPLCGLFYTDERETCCAGCPIDDKSGHGCKYTPYEQVSGAAEDWDECNLGTPRFRACRKAFQSAAKAEVDFLKSLLPVES